MAAAVPGHPCGTHPDDPVVPGQRVLVGAVQGTHRADLPASGPLTEPRGPLQERVAGRLRSHRTRHMWSRFFRATMASPKAPLKAVDVTRRQPRNPLAREAVQPAPTRSTVATASEVLTATKTVAPRKPNTSSVPRGMKDALTLGHPWLKIARIPDQPRGVCVTAWRASACA